ncbi:hypothetical protein HIM_02028 [Hirsutella minnesotensis 3608]|nr:hypothetical protein HIM_02028 [Hirsutella minnesotensis 3608]
MGNIITEAKRGALSPWSKWPRVAGGNGMDYVSTARSGRTFDVGHVFGSLAAPSLLHLRSELVVFGVFFLATDFPLTAHLV